MSQSVNKVSAICLIVETFLNMGYWKVKV